MGFCIGSVFLGDNELRCFCNIVKKSLNSKKITNIKNAFVVPTIHTHL